MPRAAPRPGPKDREAGAEVRSVQGAGSWDIAPELIGVWGVGLGGLLSQVVEGI